MKIYLTEIENADHSEFLEKALPLLSNERREKTLSYKNESDRVTSAAAELLLGFAVDEQMMSGGSLFTDAPEERGVHLRPISWHKLTAGETGFAYTYDKTDSGKPFFSEPGAPFFSISHTANVAVVVISDAPVGIDIEGDRSVNESLVRKAFSESDAGFILAGADEDEQRDRFLRGWTLKESYVKMRGDSVFKETPVLFEGEKIAPALLEECIVVEETYERYRIAAMRAR